MRRIVLSGGGTAGTLVANRLRRDISVEEPRTTVVDRDDEHIYRGISLQTELGQIIFT